MYFRNIETTWPIEKPLTFSLLQGGVNNQIWKVAMAREPSYVLRLIPANSDLAHIHYEIAILKALSEKTLPFLLPIPIQARNGESIGTIQQDNGETTLALLAPLLLGSLHDRNAAAIATSAAIALSQLDTALAEIMMPDRTEDVPSLSTFGKLTRLHPLSPGA